MLIDIDHDNAVTTWKTKGVDANGNLKTALVIETDLVISEGFAGYNKDAVAALTKHVVDYIKSNPGIDYAVLHSLPEYEAETEG